MIIGAPEDDDNGSETGAAFVVFGDVGLGGSPINLTDVTAGTGGFKIIGGAAFDYSGFAVASGDINGDGLDDLIIGGHTEGIYEGIVDVVFGVVGGLSTVNLSDIAGGTGGFRITGEANGDYAGAALSSGDVNGDGFDDIIIGAYANDAGGAYAGAAYVVFGADFSGAVTEEGTAGNDTLTGSAGVDVMIGGLGDDLLIGNGGADVLRGGAGDDDFQIADTTFVRIAGGNGIDAIEIQGSGIALDLTAIGDTRISGIEEIDLTGTGNNSVTLSVNEVNAASDNATMTIIGDAGDAVVTTDIWEFFGAENVGGETFQRFESQIGETTLLVDLDVDTSGLLSQQISSEALIDFAGGGFKITGEAAGDVAGYSVGSAGDVNGDGIDDLIVGAKSNDAGGSNAGAAYVVFGSTSSVSAVNLDDVASGTGGFKITGQAGGDQAGNKVTSAGDVNGDGIDDLLVGARTNGGGNEGAAYVVFGTTSSVTAVNLDIIALGTAGGFKIIGEAATDEAGYAVSAAGDANGDGFDDLIVGAELNNKGGVSAGAAYVLFGFDITGNVTALGTAGDDTLTGSAGVDVMIGGVGDDVLIGNGGADVLRGGAGDDDFQIADTTFARIAGGLGVDAIEIQGSGVALDLTAIGDTRISGVEEIDLTGTGNNSVTLSVNEVNAASDNATMTIIGDAGDAVVTTDVWEFFGAINVGGETFQGYESQTRETTLLVDLDIDVSGLQILNPLASGVVFTQFDDPIEDGFKIVGEDAGDFLGSTVSGAGDFNDDGILDLIVGGNFGESGGTDAAYVVFGGGNQLIVDLDAVALGTGGFKLTAEGGFGYIGSVSNAGDVNGDGIDDVIVGDYTEGNVGSAYVVFGSATPPGAVDLGALGTGGFAIIGEAASDQAGYSVSAAVDVNGDGTDDVIVGARFADGSFGAAYVVFGDSNLTTINLNALGTGGFKILSEDEFSRTGSAVSGIGDVNGDGIDDIAVGAPQYASGATTGAAYVVFGSENFAASVALSDISGGTGGFRLIGATNSFLGSSVAGAGDVNGDGIADLIIGDRGNDSAATGAGAAYVVFGTDQGFAASTTADALAAGTGGFKITGEALADYAGFGVSSAGDVDGDGLDDILVGAYGQDLGGGVSDNFGAGYLIFGVAGGSTSVDLIDVANGTGGIRITGEALGDTLGRSGSAAGDINGDGFDDLIVGADGNDTGGSNAGAAYVLFGGDVTGSVTQIGTAGDDTLTGSAGVDVMIGGQGGDLLIGNGGADVLRGGAGDDILRIGDDFSGRFDGGLGDDTLALQNTGLSLDLTAIGNTRITGIETIDLTGSGSNNTLTLAASDVAAMSDTGTLSVLGDGTDAVVATDVWIAGGTVTVGSQDFLSFTLDGKTLLVDTDVDTSGILAVPTSLADLNGPNGFKITGENAVDHAGVSVASAGDVNGDGIDDLIVGAERNDGAGGDRIGAAYVIFGTTSSVSAVNLDAVALGTGGFKISGEADLDYAGGSVASAGDMNGDGFGDLIVGARLNDAADYNAGAAYVIFGSGSPSSVDLAALGTGGFKITAESTFDFAGGSVASAGDLNGDGFNDLVVGAHLNDGGGGSSGAAYVIFGSASLPSSVDLAALGTVGFKINGEAAGDRAGISVASAGDVNGDGFDDLVVGAYLNNGDSFYTGAAYVIFGSGSLSSANLAALGTGGFKITGQNDIDRAGVSVASAGDVNGDGIDDLIVGAYRNDEGGIVAGAAYVIFGTTSSVTAVNLDSVALGTGGFKITGQATGDFAGFAVSSAGDVNGDGLDDLLVGAYHNGAAGTEAGAAYLIFGTTSSVTAVNLDDIALGTGGFRVTAEAAYDNAGRSVASAGDIDGDGFDDLIVGADTNNGDGSDSGAAYVIFGGDFSETVTAEGTAGDDTLTGSAGVDVMIGGQGGDLLIGNGGADVLRGGAGSDDIRITDASFARIDGGSGNDFLQLSGGFALDLTAIGDTKITGIESVEFTGAGASTLTIAVTDVQAMSDTGTLSVSVDTDDTLSVADDTVALAGVWEFVGSNTGGTLAVHQVANGATVLNGAVTTLTNEGFLSINSDQTLEFTNSTDIPSNAAFINLSNSTLTVDTGTVHNLAAGTISGGIGASQIATVNGGVFQNDGTLNFGASPGAFTVDGNLSNGDTASMLIDLGGLVPGVHDGFDQLTVTGVFGAGGTINVVEFGGFEVSAGDSFAVVETGSISGSFDDIVGLDVGGGVVLDATQSASGVSLTGMAVTHQGTAADDTLTGGSGDDVFVGGGGGDFIISGGGADLMHGGDGDDVFVAADTGFGRIDGGDGFDTVRFDGAGQSFDLGGLRGDQINAVEAFDLTGTGDNTLTLDADMVFSATRGTNAETGAGHSLIIDGDAGDAVDAGEGWSNTGTVTIGGDGYSVFESANNGAQIFVDDDVAVNLAS